MKRKKFILGILLVAIILLMGGGYAFLYYRWRHFWEPATAELSYQPIKESSDTLHVIMIGDSWAEMHQRHDSIMSSLLSSEFPIPVSFKSKGKGGAKSKEIYYYMFKNRTDGHAFEYCTQDLIETKPDYCIVMAGINDAASCLGTDFYWNNYYCIIRLLLDLGIRPVVVEMPMVNIKELYADKPIYHKLCDALRAMMTRSPLYDVNDYSSFLLQRIEESGLKDSLVIVHKEMWNADGFKDERCLYQPDNIHLNDYGYTLIDSCIVSNIKEDYVRRTKSNSITE